MIRNISGVYTLDAIVNMPNSGDRLRGSANASSNGVVQQTNNSNLYPPISSQQNRINWLELCTNPLVDHVISEPCYTLTTPDGYTFPESYRFR
jgi:hypothetical protein